MDNEEKAKFIERCLARLTHEKYESIRRKMREFYLSNPNEDVSIAHYVRYATRDIILLSTKGLEVIGKLKIPFEDFIEFLRIIILTCGEFY